MMIVEMGNQMKDLHTLLHYLPIICTVRKIFEWLTLSMGCRIDIDCLPIQSRFRKSLPPPAMGKIGCLFPQRTQSSSPAVKQSAGNACDRESSMGPR
jgi:hypothetical protein